MYNVLVLAAIDFVLVALYGPKRCRCCCTSAFVGFDRSSSTFESLVSSCARYNSLHRPRNRAAAAFLLFLAGGPAAAAAAFLLFFAMGGSGVTCLQS